MAMDNVKFHELKERDFPLKMELLSVASNEVVWETVVDGAGVIKIPKVSTESWCRVTFPDGLAICTNKDGEIIDDPTRGTD